MRRASLGSQVYLASGNVFCHCIASLLKRERSCRVAQNGTNYHFKIPRKEHPETSFPNQCLRPLTRSVLPDLLWRREGSRSGSHGPCVYIPALHTAFGWPACPIGVIPFCRPLDWAIWALFPESFCWDQRNFVGLRKGLASVQLPNELL